MKTLCSVLFVNLLAICLFCNSAIAQTDRSDAFVRDQLVTLLERSNISDLAVVDLSFTLVKNRIKIKTVETGKPNLNIEIIKYLENKYLKQTSEFNSFHLRVYLNGVDADADYNFERTLAQNSLQNQLSKMVSDSVVREKGEATIILDVNNNKQVKIVDIKSENPVLATKIKNMLEIAKLEISTSAIGQYAIKMTF